MIREINFKNKNVIFLERFTLKVVINQNQFKNTTV